MGCFYNDTGSNALFVSGLALARGSPISPKVQKSRKFGVNPPFADLNARAYAFIRRRGYVIPEDVRAVCHDVLRHRIGLTYEAEAENITTEEIITDILNNVIVP